MNQPLSVETRLSQLKADIDCLQVQVDFLSMFLSFDDEIKERFRLFAKTISSRNEPEQAELKKIANGLLSAGLDKT